MENIAFRNDPLSNLLDIIFTRKLIIFVGFISVFCVVIIGVLLMPPVYETYTKIYINKPSLPRVDIPYINEIGGRSFLANQKEIIGSRFILAKLVRKLKLYEGKRISLKRMLVGKVYDLLGIEKPLPDPFEESIAVTRKNITINFKRGTNIVTIGASSRTPEGAADMANTLAQIYIEYLNSFLFSKSQSAYSYLKRQVEKAKKKLSQSENTLDKFKEREAGMSIDSEKIFIANKIAMLEDKLNQINAKIQNLKQIKNKPNSKGNEGTEETNSKEEVQNLKKLREQLQTRLTKILSLYTDEYPDAKLLKARIAKIDNKIINLESNKKTLIKNINKNELKNKIYKLVALRKSLNKSINIYSQKKTLLAKKQIEYEKLTRSYLQDSKRLSALIAKLDNASILNASDVKKESVRIIDPAYIPTYSERKKKIVLLIVGFITSIIFSLGMALFAEYLDDSLKTVEDTEEYLDLTVIGTIPRIKKMI